MSDELKPCPFCGEPATAEQTNEGNWFVCCYNDDGCGMTPQVWGVTYKEAAASWNTRPVEDALRAELNRVAVFLAVHGVEGYTIEPKEAAE